VKTLPLLVLASLLFVAPALHSAEPITEVTLASGRVLKRVKFVRWEKERVVIDYAGGADPIAFSLIKSIPLKDLYEMRDAALREAANPKKRTITGQVFVTTRGNGAYKFSEVTVFAVPAGAFSLVELKARDEIASARAMSNSANAPDERAIRYRLWSEAASKAQPVAYGRTDADGYYSLNYSGRQPVVLFCTASRLVGRDHELNVWAVPIESEDRIDLTSANSL
jgi:hypothetical protein